MCLIAFAWQQHPEYPLIVIANRDEFYARASNNLHLWPKNNILAGRDLQAGGTWMGCTAEGRWAAVTNVRDGRKNKAKTKYLISRGKLVQNFLESTESCSNYLQSLKKQADQYDGFNLLCGDRNELNWFSNHPQKHRTLSPGIYGLSNAELNSDWPKVHATRQELEQIINKPVPLNINSLLQLLESPSRATDQELPDTGIDKSLESKLSSSFIQLEEYGTRCSSILLFSKNYLQFLEVQHSATEKRISEKTFRRYFS